MSNKEDNKILKYSVFMLGVVGILWLIRISVITLVFYLTYTLVLLGLFSALPPLTFLEMALIVTFLDILRTMFTHD